MLLKLHTKVALHNLHFSAQPVESDQYAVVRWDTDDSILVGREAYSVLRFLQQPHTVSEIIEKTDLGTKEVISFLHQLIDMNFVKELDGALLPDFGTKIHPWKLPFDRKYLKILTDKNFHILILVFIVSGLLFGIILPGYLPSYRDFFWTQDYLLVLVSMFIIGNIYLFIHELGHLFTTFAIDGSATMRLSTRFVFLVAETESYHLAVVPKVKRYFVYIAGLAVDFFFVSLLYWLIRILDVFFPDLTVLKMFFKANIVILVSRIIWQYNIYLETDMYNAVSEYLKIDYLRQSAVTYILHKIHRLSLLTRIFSHKVAIGHAAAKATTGHIRLSDFTKNQQQYLLVYALVLVTGFIMIIVDTVLFQLPREYTLIRGSVVKIITSVQASNLVEVAKSALVILLISYQYILIFITRVRESRNVRRD